ncbi:MAG TPA: APC family permease, partial [Pyrinomonadaceae bacterium]
GFFWPRASDAVPRAIIIVVVVILLAALNVFGVRQAAIASNLFTVGKLIPLIIFIAAGLFFLNPKAYAFGPAPSAGTFSQSVLLLIYAFTGFEMAAIPAGEIRNPQKHLPRALLIAIAVVAVIYIFVQIVCIGTLPGLGSSTKPLADAGQQFLGTAGGAIISAGAIISIVGNLNILVLSGSRVPFAIAERQQLPAFLARVHQRFSTPHVAIMITAAVMMILTLKSSFAAALTISAIARLVTYVATCVALPVLRRRKDVADAVFKVPGGSIIAVVSLIVAAWLLTNNLLGDLRAHKPWWAIEAIQATIAAAAGLLIYLTYRALRYNFRRANASGES